MTCMLKRLVSLSLVVLRHSQVAVMSEVASFYTDHPPPYGRMHRCVLSTQQLMDFGLFPVFSHYE